MITRQDPDDSSVEDRSAYLHTCGNQGEYLSTSCGADSADAVSDERVEFLDVDREDLGNLHKQCRRVCKWCPALCGCRECGHTGPVSWYFVEMRYGRWVVRMDNQGPGRPWPGMMSPRDVQTLFAELHAHRWVGEYTPLVAAALPRPWGVRLLLTLAGKKELL